MQAFQKRLSGLTERNWLLLLMLLFFSFAGAIAVKPALTVIGAAILPWGVGLAYCKFRAGEYPKTAALRWTCAMLALYVLSTLATMTASMDWMTNFWAILVTSLVILFVPRELSSKDVRREILSIGVMFVCLYLPFALMALYSVFTGHTVRLPGISEAIGIQAEGFVDDRLRIFAHPNTTARYASYNILFCIYAIAVCRRAFSKAFFGFNALLNALVLAHAQSRTGSIALCTAIGAIALRWVYLKLPARKWRFPVSLIACAVVMLAGLQLLEGFYALDIRIAQRISPSAELYYGGASRTEALGQFDVSSTGRNVIWASALSYLKDNPRYLLLGMGYGDLIPAIAQSYPQIAPHLNLHNTYLACLAQCGLPYLICVLGFLCTLVRPALRMLTAPASDETRGQFIIPTFVGMMLILSVPEEMLFVTSGFSNMLFYMFCGYLLHYQALLKD